MSDFYQILMIFLSIIAFFLTLSIFIYKKESAPTDIENAENYLLELYELITHQEKQLEHLTHNTPAPPNNLSSIVNQALDLYENSNIKLPIDIIEELSLERFTSVDQAIKFIENKRNYWTLENRKKPYKED